MRILITGSRDWPDDNSVEYMITDFIRDQIAQSNYGPFTVVHGACPTGADWLAGRLVRTLSSIGRPIYEEPHPADWNTYGKSAGYRRNAEMVELGADIVLAFQKTCQKCPDADHGSHGTQHTIDLARAAGLRVEIYQKA